MRDFMARLLEPHTLLLLGLVGTAAWSWQRKNSRRYSLGLAGVLLGILYFLSTPLAGFLAMRSLEWPYLNANAVPRPGDTIVVLSGGVQRDDDNGEQVRVGSDTFFRCYHAARLYKNAGSCRLLLTGGKVDHSEPGPSLAKVMRDFVLELGVKSSDVILEEESSNTYQNAAFSKVLLDRTNFGRVLLVTDAAHMPRAQFSFESQETTVIPAPCNFRSRLFHLSPQDLLPSIKGMSNVNYASHEWLGLVWYRLRSLGNG
jgi:uncharacterized SAM-binding protein YcdF (DUF218 family)